VTRLLTRQPNRGLGATVVVFAHALLPLGLGVWIAHYGFHFLTGMLTIVPVTQSAAIDLLGWPVLGDPLWGLTGMQPGAVYPIQLGFVLLGAVGAIGLAEAIAWRDYPRRHLRAGLAWVCIILLLAAAALWILSLPMDMRGVSG
jgi:hypothetical protein